MKTRSRVNVSFPPVLRIADARPGDIFVYADRSRFSPKAILLRLFCDSHYVHAAVYVGNGKVIEATLIKGVRVADVVPPRRGHIAVVRTQLGDCTASGFDERHKKALSNFLDQISATKARYNLGVIWLMNVFGLHKKRRERHFASLVYLLNRSAREDTQRLREHVTNNIEIPAFKYWCSELVGRIYFEVGLFGRLMDVAQPPRLLLPETLVTERDFGWLLGVIAIDGYAIPDDDVCLGAEKHWETCSVTSPLCVHCPYRLPLRGAG